MNVKSVGTKKKSQEEKNDYLTKEKSWDFLRYYRRGIEYTYQYDPFPDKISIDYYEDEK